MNDGIEALAAHARTAHVDARRPLSLEKAASEFEALLLGTLLKSGTQPIGGRSLLDGGSAGRMYRELLYQELARQATRDGAFGIGQLLERLPATGTGDARDE